MTPKLAVERELVLRLASVLWRLRRATGIETALFESVTEDSRKHEHRLSRETLGGAADLAERNRLFLGAVQESDAADGNELSSDSKKDIADCFLRLADLPTSALDRLSRYEHMLWRQARQIVFTLEVVAAPQASSRAAQPFHSRSGDASPAPCPKSSGDYRAKRLAHGLGIACNHGEIRAGGLIRNRSTLLPIAERTGVHAVRLAPSIGHHFFTQHLLGAPFVGMAATTRCAR